MLFDEKLPKVSKEKTIVPHAGVLVPGFRYKASGIPFVVTLFEHDGRPFAKIAQEDGSIELSWESERRAFPNKIYAVRLLLYSLRKHACFPDGYAFSTVLVNIARIVSRYIRNRESFALSKTNQHFVKVDTLTEVLTELCGKEYITDKEDKTTFHLARMPIQVEMTHEVEA